MSSPSDVYRRALDAYVAFDREAIEALVAPDYVFTNARHNALDRDGFLKLCWPHAEGTTGFDVVEMCETGDGGLFVILDWRKTEGAARSAEFSRIRNGRFVSTEVYSGWPLPHPGPVGRAKPAEAGV